MNFEWDETKNQKNYAKHKINFELARTGFDDPLAQFFIDRVVYGEERWWVIREVSNKRLEVISKSI